MSDLLIITWLCVVYLLTTFVSVGGRPMELEPIDKLLTADISILKTSSVTGENLVEWDMMLTREQYRAIHKHRRRSARAVLSDERYRWTDAVIPYEFADAFTDDDRRVIRIAMDEWEKYTCIKFIPRTNQENYVRIIDGRYCWSNVGMVGGRQFMSLDRTGNCLYHRPIIHELGHTIGRHHEQTRPDRNGSITVLNHNVESDLKENFDPYDWTYLKDLGVKYDYWSIMHYSQYAFTKNDMRTIKTQDGDYQSVIGKVPRVSLKDLHTANLMYGCTDHCLRSRCPRKSIMSGDCQCLCNTGNPYKPVVVWDGFNECLGPDDKEASKCRDNSQYCQHWADHGECDKNPRYMERYCRKACKVCQPGSQLFPSANCTYYSDSWCQQFYTNCSERARRGECESKPHSVVQNCPIDCGVCGPKKNSSCKNFQASCERMARDGGCETSEEYMEIYCRAACKCCD